MKLKGLEAVRTTVWSAGPGCHGGCGVIAYLRDGKLVKIEGDKEHPWNQGRLCARVLSMTQYLEHPLRIRRPLKRVGERGEGKWEEISWEEAFDLIEARMKAIRERYGPQSMVFAMGTGRDIGPWICMLAYAYGSPNVMFALSGIACYSPRIAALDAIQGDFCVFDAAQWFPKRYEDPRYEPPKAMIIWGYNISATCPDNLFGHWIVDLMKRGTELIVVDPRLTWFASRAKYWLRIRPGTDAALAMGFLRVIMEEGLYDEDFVRKWTNAPFLVREDKGRLLRESDLREDGSPERFLALDKRGRLAIWDPQEVAYVGEGVEPVLSGSHEVELKDGRTVRCRTVWEALRERVSEFTPERVAEICWVDPKAVEEAARFFARSKPASVHWGVPIDMTPEVTPLCHAIASLWAVTGNLDRPGGMVIARYAFDAVAYALPGAKGVIRLKDPEQDRPRIGADRFPPLRHFIWRCHTDTTLEQIFSEDPYPIKGMWIQGCNLLAGTGMDPKRWREALRKLEFVVVVDLFLTPTAQYADVVLPAATFLEKEGVRSWWIPLQAMRKVVEVPHCKADVEINFELARRFDPDFPYRDIHELFDAILAPSGLTFEELKERGWAFPPEGHPSVPYRRHEKGLLRPDGKPGFRTPSGLFELYSILREQWGYDPLPRYKEPPFSPVSRPDLAERYPLILSTGRRSPAYFHTEHRMIPWLRRIEPDPVVEIHPETAKGLAIEDGDWVWVENWMGRAKLRAKVTPVVPPWMVMATHGWWFPERDGREPELYGVWEHNINQLIPMGVNGEDGLGAPIKHLLCRVYKAEEGR